MQILFAQIDIDFVPAVFEEWIRANVFSREKAVSPHLTHHVAAFAKEEQKGRGEDRLRRFSKNGKVITESDGERREPLGEGLRELYSVWRKGDLHAEAPQATGLVEVESLSGGRRHGEERKGG